MSKGKVVIAKPVNQPEVTEINPRIQEIMDTGIKLKFVIFHDVVKSFEGNGTPEFAFYDVSEKAKPGRTCNLWYTPHTLLMEKNGKFKPLPTSCVKDTMVL